MAPSGRGRVSGTFARMPPRIASVIHIKAVLRLVLAISRVPSGLKASGKAWIDPAPQPMVQAQDDHAPQASVAAYSPATGRTSTKLSKKVAPPPMSARALDEVLLTLHPPGTSLFQ